MTAPSLTPLEALTVEAFGLTLDEELDFDLECESPQHPMYVHGHDGGPARYIFTCPACHGMSMLCEGSTLYTINLGKVMCPKEKQKIAVSSENFQLIAGDHA